MDEHSFKEYQIRHWEWVKSRMQEMAEKNGQHLNSRELFESTQCAPGEAIRASGLVSLDDTEGAEQ